METTVRIRSRGTNPTLWLEVDYAGLQPPLGLFADLEMIGWAPPAIQPPPAKAIDWSTPNETTGERYTVRPYPVEGAVVQPPAGAGKDGSWTPAERKAFEQTLMGVLRRHEVAPDDLPAAPALLTAADKAENRAEGTKRRFGRRERSPAVPVAGAVAAGPAAGSGVLPAQRVVAEGILLEATVTPADGLLLEETVNGLGYPALFRTVEAKRMEHYRGSHYEVFEPAHQAIVVVPAAEVQAVVEQLSAHPLVDPADVLAGEAPVPTGIQRPSDSSPSPSLDDSPLAPVTSLEGRRTVVDPTQARIVMVFDPHHKPRVMDLLGAMGLQPLALDTVLRISTGHYRGSSYEATAPALRLEVAVDVGAAPRTSVLLAQAAEVDAADEEQLVIRFPEPLTSSGEGDGGDPSFRSGTSDGFVITAS